MKCYIYHIVNSATVSTRGKDTHTHAHTHTHTSHTPSHNGTHRPTHLPTMGHSSHTATHFPTDGAQTHSNWTYLLFLLPSGLLLVQLTRLHPLPAPPPFIIIIHTVGAARQGPAGSGGRRRNTLGRVSTPPVFCWHGVHSNT